MDDTNTEDNLSRKLDRAEAQIREISAIAITLSEPETLGPGDVTATGITVANYGPVTISGSGTSYTITLAQPITIGR